MFPHAGRLGILNLHYAVPQLGVALIFLDRNIDIYFCVDSKVGWSRQNLIKKLRENPEGVTLVLKKVPISLVRQEKATKPPDSQVQVGTVWQATSSDKCAKAAHFRNSVVQVH